MKSKDFSKSKKQQGFLASIPSQNLEDSNIAIRSKFNFSYLDTNPPGKDFIDFNEQAGNSKLAKLVNKLKDFTRESLEHWEREKIGRGKKGANKRQSVLELYHDGFPSLSDFKHPSHVPEDVLWGRFRIDNDTRLAGFVIPRCFGDEKSKQYDLNTFYVVFLDDNHGFYKFK
jgi:hypothetical protein